MKKMRYITILAITSLLATGCSNSLKAPTFANEGEEFNFVQFKERYLQAKKDSELSDYDYFLTDRVFKASYSSSDVHTLKRDKAEIYKSETQSVATGESQYDTDSLAAKMVAENKSSQKVTSQESNFNASSTTNAERYYQISQVSRTKYLVFANAKTKVYRLIDPVSYQNTAEDLFDNQIREDITSTFYNFEDRMPYTGSEAKDYLFYVSNETLFTYTINKEQEQNLSSYKLYTKIKCKAQLDLTDKKQSLRLSYEFKEELTYTRSEDSYKPGDVVTNESKVYIDYTFYAKEARVNPVDLSDYTQEFNY